MKNDKAGLFVVIFGVGWQLTAWLSGLLLEKLVSQDIAAYAQVPIFLYFVWFYIKAIS
jgi:predicted MFS family arabinose efflux permease